MAKQKINYKYNFILMVLPLVWIWGLYRIKKLRLGALIQLGLVLGFIGITNLSEQHMTLYSEQHFLLLAVSGLTIPLWWILNKRWVTEYNTKIPFK